MARMPHDETTRRFTVELQTAIRREIALADGRLKAFKLARDCMGHAGRLEAALREAEDQLDGESPSSSGTGNHSVDFAHSYMQALRDAIHMIRTLNR
jgi:hypothetical protein